MAQRTWIREYSSWSAIIDSAETGKSTLPESYRASRRGGSSIFHATEGFEHSVKLARYGWAEGREKIKAITDRFYARFSQEIEKPETTYRVRGSSMNMGRVIADHPKPFITRSKTNVPAPGHGKIVTIYYNVSASGGASQDALFRRGAACAALIYLLEVAGRRVRVVIGDTMGSRTGAQLGKTGEWASSPSYYVGAEIKRPDMPLQLDILAFALANPDALRRIFFSLEECEESDILRTFGIPGGYGYPIEFPEDKRGDIYFGKLWGRLYNDEESMERWIVETLEAQGVELIKR